MTETPPPIPAPRPTSFQEIIDLWPEATDLANHLGFHKSRIYQWRRRKRIDVDHWDAIIAAVRDVHGIELTVDDLYAMARAVPSGKTQPRAA